MAYKSRKTRMDEKKAVIDLFNELQNIIHEQPPITIGQAARITSVAPSTITGWVKQASVYKIIVVKPSKGPGKKTLLNTKSILIAAEIHKRLGHHGREPAIKLLPPLS